MFFFIGVLIVLGSVVGGFAIEGGNLSILIQPVEAMMVLGVAIGAFIISNPPSITQGVFKAIPQIIFPRGHAKRDYLDVLVLLYQIVMKIRREGVISIESDINNPYKSEFFHAYGSSLLHNPKLLTFVCDNLKMVITGDVSPNDFESLMDTEIETMHREGMALSHSVARMGDAMPGLGLVAAVLGVVLTMMKIDQPPQVIGHSIAVALLGTFLGILMCYGFIGPIATSLEHKTSDDTIYFRIVKIVLGAFRAGTAPITAIEFARRAVPSQSRPTFEELDKARRGQASVQSEPEAAKQPEAKPQEPAAAATQEAPAQQ